MNELITVCASCLRASCWQSAVICEDYHNASTVEKTVDELRALALESADYWQPVKPTRSGQRIEKRPRLLV